MAQYTQKAILSTFEQMLEEMPFDKITVSALVRRCEISSNTFYYHYRDIYNLLDVWVRAQLKPYVEMSPGYDWKRSAKQFFRDCEERSNVIYHIFNSLSRDRMEHFVFTLGEDVFYRVLCAYAVDYDAPADKLHDLAEVCRFSFAGLFLRFVWGRMREDVDPMIDNYCALLEEMVSATVAKYPAKNR